MTLLPKTYIQKILQVFSPYTVSVVENNDNLEARLQSGSLRLTHSGKVYLPENIPESWVVDFQLLNLLQTLLAAAKKAQKEADKGKVALRQGMASLGSFLDREIEDMKPSQKQVMEQLKAASTGAQHAY